MHYLNNHYDKILIIGNGFDLNLGLKTSYKDFIQSPHFQKLINHNALFAHISNQYHLNNWVDIEIELKNYSSKFSNPDFRQHYQQLCSTLITYLSELDYAQLNKSSVAFGLIKELWNQNCLIFNFNYTDSISHITKELGLTQEGLDEFEKNVVNVHGSVKENEIIFGVEDDASIHSKHIFLKKSYPLHYKAVNLMERMKLAKEIYFFGYSLGQTDHTYLKNFFVHTSHITPGAPHQKKSMFLYYYDDDAYHALFTELDTLTNKSLMGLRNNCHFKALPATGK